MSVSQTNAIAIQRQVSLFEAFLFSLATHAAILVILSLFGLLSLLTERPVERNPDLDIEVRFTIAPESPAEARSEPGDAAPSDVPPLPEAAPSQDPTEATQPDTEAPASLDQPQQMIAPAPPGEPAPSQPRPAVEEPPLPDAQIDEQADSVEPSSDGRVEGFEPQALEPEIETADTMPADTLSSVDAGVETELDLPQIDDGDFADAQQQPPPGRPLGPSLEQRISDFGRAVQRARDAAPLQPSQAPRNVFEPDWSNLPATGQALGNLTFESGDFDWEDYGRQIYWIIWRAWHNRLLARVDDFEKWAQQNNSWFLDHVNGVRFTIESNGEISSIVLESESGSIPFDLSAVEGLDEALLPPLPKDFPRDRETVHAQFIGHGPIGQMRRGLQEFKNRGWF
jgi:hypothetical protein